MTARAAALVLAVLSAGVATAADGDFTLTGSQFAIDKDVMECTSACVLKFKRPYRFSIGSAFPLGGNGIQAGDQQFFIGSSRFDVGKKLEMTFLPDGFVQLRADEIRMTKVPSTP
jgi:hypothetical protein